MLPKRTMLGVPYFILVDENVAASRVDQTHDAARYRGLARTLLADDAKCFPPLDGNIDVLGGVHLAALAQKTAGRVGLA